MSEDRCPFVEIRDHNRIVNTLRANLTAAQERAKELEKLLVDTKRALGIEWDNRVRRYESAYLQGFEDCREAAAKVAATHHDHYIQQFAKAIRTLTVPERGSHES